MRTTNATCEAPSRLPVCDAITPEEYARAYEADFNSTVRFLTSKGVTFQTAQELAQAAWARGWQTRHQLRDVSKVSVWVNSIGLNIYRNSIRSEPFLRDLPELRTTLKSDLAAIDVHTILRRIGASDREVLRRHYIDGYSVREIAQQQGRTETAIRMGLLRARRKAGFRAMNSAASSTAANQGAPIRRRRATTCELRQPRSVR